MERDRDEIVRIVSEMLDNPVNEIYPTTKCYDELENYIDTIRHETMGWIYAYACNLLDEGKDIREIEVPEIIEKALEELK
jgi:hypothetical protein